MTHSDLVQFYAWSGERPLTRDGLRTCFVGRLDRPHVWTGCAWDQRVAKYEAAGAQGRVAYVSRIEFDDAEPGQLRVELAEARYAEFLAAHELASDPSAQACIGDVLSEGMGVFAAVSPPTLVSASVAVISSEDSFLVLRRSLAVRTFRHQWTVGINESMEYCDEPGAEEDFFKLVERGLHEELGLDLGDYGPIGISWLGWSQPASCWVLFAAVRSTLPESAIDDRRLTSDSADEHDLARWLPLDGAVIDGIISSATPGPDGAAPWAYFAPLAAAEIWRYRTLV